MDVSTTCRSLFVLASLVLVGSSALASEDPDGAGYPGSWVAPPVSGAGTMCHPFGGSAENFVGSQRFRGNVYTFDEAQTLTQIVMELGFTGSADLYFYVMEAATVDGTYTPTTEVIVTTPGIGQALYGSPLLSVAVTPGVFYAIGVAWAGETLEYYRSPINLPRPWALGTVEGGTGINTGPPYGKTEIIGPFLGGEYSMQLCLESPVSVEDESWGRVKGRFAE